MIDGARLGVRPAGVLNDAEKAALRQHRDEVLAMLHAPAAELATLWPASLPNHGRRATGAFVACATCGSGTWVRFGPTPLCLLCAAELGLAGHAKTLADLLRASFETAASREPRHDFAQVIAQEIARLADDCGPSLAARISGNAAWEWFREHRTCPWCGEPGVFHEPRREAGRSA